MDLFENRIEREKKTIKAMIGLYCKDHHRSKVSLCNECEELLAYADNRLSNCRFGNEKTTCRKCEIHCYRPDMRERIIRVMKYSGPRMLLKHPVLTLWHILDR